MASCRSESQSYRSCLKDARTSGGGKCTFQAQTLEACREKVRRVHNLQHEFDGTRVLPNAKCQPLNMKVQSCMKWKKGDHTQCQEPMDALQACMKKEKGVVAPPTEGDKIWSDYKPPTNKPQ